MYTLPNPFSEETGNDEVTIVVNIKLKPGRGDKIEQLMADVIDTNRAEEGNLEFTFLKVRGKSDEYVLVERWKNQTALDWHMQRDYTQAMFVVLEESLAFPMSEVYEHIQFVRELSPVK